MFSVHGVEWPTDSTQEEERWQQMRESLLGGLKKEDESNDNAQQEGAIVDMPANKTQAPAFKSKKRPRRNTFGFISPEDLDRLPEGERGPVAPAKLIVKLEPAAPPPEPQTRQKSSPLPLVAVSNRPAQPPPPAESHPPRLISPTGEPPRPPAAEPNRLRAVCPTGAQLQRQQQPAIAGRRQQSPSVSPRQFPPASPSAGPRSVEQPLLPPRGSQPIPPVSSSHPVLPTSNPTAPLPPFSSSPKPPPVRAFGSLNRSKNIQPTPPAAYIPSAALPPVPSSGGQPTRSTSLSRLPAPEAVTKSTALTSPTPGGRQPQRLPQERSEASPTPIATVISQRDPFDPLPPLPEQRFG